MKLNIQYLVILKQLYENKIFNVNDILQEAVPNQPENAQDTGDEAKFEFTKLECLLFAFHTLGQQAPHFLSENATLLKDFKVNNIGNFLPF